ncbi:triose-phosphate isomerase [Bradyrhizobium sp. SZCCHNRI20481]|uniref:triose-phosphate isomerase n=1 Tax=Bradyrhizobium sp. SZCCHNRI20481 TaxID=3057286 RepID=UPI0029165AB4|nr:triose-phosphate isomerase [Bradyrhizobium sp. SZCCHNRI20481]
MEPKLIAGNWKMHGTLAECIALASALREKARNQTERGCEFVVFPPTHLLVPVGHVIAGTGIGLGGQDCHVARFGPYTGNVSAAMLRDVGCRYVIVGHSERRGPHGETDGQVRSKAQAGIREGITPIVCVGETTEDYAAGRATSVISRQLIASVPDTAMPERIAVAYEPIWAIGASSSATIDHIGNIHSAIRSTLGGIFGRDKALAIRILYGGAVGPESAPRILQTVDVDGVLVGRASLNAAHFLSLGAPSN